MRVLALALSAVLCAGVPVASAGPEDDFGRARATFRAGDFAEVIPILSSLLYPAAQLARREELAEAHLLLGVSYFETGDPQAAIREFDEALFIDSNLTLDPMLFSAKVVRFFEERKKEMEAQRRANEKASRAARERDAAIRALENSVQVEQRDYYVNFIPFGMGQFQNGHRVKGIALATSQGILGTTSLALFTYLLTTYRLQGDVPPDEADSVRNLQILQVTTGGMTLALMVYGIIDSLYYYKPTVVRKIDIDLLPKELRDKIEGDKPLKPDLSGGASSSSSLRIMPVPFRGGGGIGASWEF